MCLSLKNLPTYSFYINFIEGNPMQKLLYNLFLVFFGLLFSLSPEALAKKVLFNNGPIVKAQDSIVIHVNKGEKTVVDSKHYGTLRPDHYITRNQSFINLGAEWTYEHSGLSVSGDTDA